MIDHAPVLCQQEIFTMEGHEDEDNERTAGNMWTRGKLW